MNEHKTAIKRHKLSAPMKYLYDKGLLKGRCLDYGCGRGDDVTFLSIEGIDISGYDPHYLSDIPCVKYDTISCIYVLNVLSEHDVDSVVHKIQQLLRNKSSIAYIAVRRDFREDYVNRDGVSQRIVKLDFPILIEYKNKFAIYKIIK